MVLAVPFVTLNNSFSSRPLLKGQKNRDMNVFLSSTVMRHSHCDFLRMVVAMTMVVHLLVPVSSESDQLGTSALLL